MPMMVKAAERIDKAYPVSCYRAAIRNLPDDVASYSNAREEINRALGRAQDDAVSRDELGRLAEQGAILLVDVRPREEFEHGHLPGAVPIPLEELERRLDELPRDRRIVAYCRGEYCLFADEAVELLRSRGFEAVRLDGGWLEWLVEGRAAAP